MRFFLFLLLISPSAYSVPCDESDIVPGAFITCTSLIVNSQVNLSGSEGSQIQITVNGDVEINANIILDGNSGINITVINGNGGFSGPGATRGGGISAGASEPGQGFGTEDGSPGSIDPACGSGGGGGSSAIENGSIGQVCVGGSTSAIGGTSPGLTPLVGGFGGGAGAAKQISFAPAIFDLGGGGGGGGALLIDATGSITIRNGVLLSSRGGNGGNSVNIGGAGGGGGGGMIQLISDTAIINQGIFDVSGGSGGFSLSGASPRGGVGGNGGGGIAILDVNGTVTNITGRQDFSVRSSLNSDISCGTLAKPNDNKNAYQMMMGFVLILMLSWISKTLFQLRARI